MGMKKNKLQWGTSGDAILLMMIKLVTILLGFAVTRLLSQHLSVREYGTYSQIMLIVSTVNTMTILGMIDGTNFFYCCETDIQKREAFISTIFALQTIIGIVAGSLVMLLSSQICIYFDNPDIADLLFFSAALPLPINLISMIQVLLVSTGRAKMLAIRNLLVSILRLAAVILAVAIFDSVVVVLFTTLLLDVLQLLLFGWVLKKNGCPIRAKTVDFHLVGRILRYCAPMGVFTVVSALNRDCDKYLIGLMTNTETLAIYTNASKVLPFDIVMNSFCTVLVPQITKRVGEKNYQAAANLYRQFLEISYITTTILCCASLSAAPQLMELLYSNKYLSGITVFSIYILVDLLRFTNITMVLAAAGKTKKLMLFSLCALTANALLNVLLFQLFGITGPAIATLITTFLLGATIVVSGSNELGIRVHQLFDGKYLLTFMAENAVAVMIFARVQRWLTGKGIHYFPVLLLVGGGYGLLMLLLHGKRLLRSLKNVNKVTGSD